MYLFLQQLVSYVYVLTVETLVSLSFLGFKAFMAGMYFSIMGFEAAHAGECYVRIAARHSFSVHSFLITGNTRRIVTQLSAKNIHPLRIAL